MKYSIPALVLFVSSLAAAPIKVDLSVAMGRKDTATPGWHEWQVKDAREATKEFDGVRVTLRATGDSGQTLGTTWFKQALAAGATLTCDGVIVAGEQAPAVIEMELHGLTAGHHTLVTYHNSTWEEPVGSYQLSLDEKVAIPSLTPSERLKDDSSAESAFLEFEAVADQPTVLRIANNKDGKLHHVILNGFEIDAVNPKLKARKPAPAYADLHANGDSGKIGLRWSAAPGATQHKVYFASDSDLATCVDKIARADEKSPAFIATTGKTSQEVAVVPRNTRLYYCWRIDSIDAKGTITRGDIWHFRVRHLAFPGAEGYGRFAMGGRAGRVIKVTNLNDDGPGSLRAAVEADGPRTVVFDVSGRIVLKSKLVIRNPYLTIAGQTAPAKGICISNYNLGMLGARDVIVRFIRVRPGDPAGVTLDGMGMASSDHCIIDHCSISWTQDESFSSRGAFNITFQRNLVSEALNVAGHSKYAEGKQHGFAASIGGDIGSFHHNLLAHCAGRNWSLAGGLDRAGVHTGRLDIRNNVVFNWGHRTTDGGAEEVNFVNNYYKPGPASKVFHVLKPERNPFGPQDYYVAGNVMEGHYGPNKPLAGVVEPRNEPLSAFIKAKPFFEPYVVTHTAAEAYENVLADVGCNIPSLDAHDQRVVQEVRSGKTTFKGSKTGLPGLPDSQNDVGGWEEYPEVHRPADWDADHDGMADAWERNKGLNPADAADGALDPDGDGYTNLEDYFNWIAAGGKLG